MRRRGRFREARRPAGRNAEDREDRGAERVGTPLSRSGEGPGTNDRDLSTTCAALRLMKVHARQFLVLGRYLPSSSATKTMPDPTARKSHKLPTTLLTGITKPRPTASIVAHITPLTTADTFSSLLAPFIFGYPGTHRPASSS